MVDASFFVFIVRSSVAITTPLRFPFSFVVVESPRESVAISVASSLNSTPLATVFTEVEESLVFISSDNAPLLPPPAVTASVTNYRVANRLPVDCAVSYIGPEIIPPSFRNRSSRSEEFISRRF